jgi:hypothetical protein
MTRNILNNSKFVEIWKKLSKWKVFKIRFTNSTNFPRFLFHFYLFFCAINQIRGLCIWKIHCRVGPTCQPHHLFVAGPLVRSLLPHGFHADRGHHGKGRSYPKADRLLATPLPKLLVLASQRFCSPPVSIAANVSSMRQPFTPRVPLSPSGPCPSPVRAEAVVRWAAVASPELGARPARS